MQTALEKGLEQAGGSLREKAGEISGLFASELDHYSRSYVEHTQGQIEENARATLERLGKSASELAATSAASLAQQARNHGEAALGEFRGKSAAAFDQVAARMDERTAQVRAAWDAETSRVSAQFRETLAQQTQQTMDGARQELASQVVLAADNVRLTAETADQQLRQAMLGVSDDAVNDYKKRLENASNSWLLATVAKLNQQSEQHLEKVAHSTEERLRESCNQVFSSLGETLRLRMLSLFDSPDRDKPSSQSK
jgi:hypothetical protein